MTAKDDRPRVAFLFGAGASIPAGMSSTKSITDDILSARYLHLTSEPERVPQILDILTDYLEHHRSSVSQMPTTYEDIYNLGAQVHTFLTDRMRDPALAMCANQIAQSIKSQVPRDADLSRSAKEWLAETLTYIRKIVELRLTCVKCKTGHLAWLSNTLNHRDVRCRGIITLNHDQVLETFLINEGIKHEDGFRKQPDGLDLLDFGRFQDDSTPWLLKIHGSIDWYVVQPSPKPDEGRCFARLPHSNAAVPSGYQKSREMPVMLIGTTNKLFAYNSEAFESLRCVMRSTMQQCSRLVVCGYGFGDIGINDLIFPWVFLKATRKMLVVDPDLEALIERTPWLSDKNRAALAEKDQLHFLEKYIQDVELGKVLKLIKA